MRIHVHETISYTSTTGGLDPDKLSFLTDVLLPQATAWLQAALSVVPIDGNLLVQRMCYRYSSVDASKCAQEILHAPCQITSDSGTRDQVPATMKTALDIYDCSSGTCSVHAPYSSSAGSGVAADFVLFVSAHATSVCSGGALAFAGTCIRDQYDRPIVG